METIDLVQVREFLQNNFDKQASAVQHIGTGWWSHAYAFTVGQQSFIVRVSIFMEMAALRAGISICSRCTIRNSPSTCTTWLGARSLNWTCTKLTSNR